MTKVLGIERFMPAFYPPNPKKGEIVGILLPAGTEVKRGDIIVADKSLENLNPCGEEIVCKAIC